MQGKAGSILLQIAGCFILLSLIGPLSIGAGGTIPITFQTFFVLLPAMLFGWRVGIAVVCLYLLAGGMGVPVFSGFSGGYQKLLGVSGGYLLAFPVAAGLAGAVREKMERISYPLHVLTWSAAHLLIIVIGLTWQLIYTGDALAGQIPLLKKFLVGASVKSLAGALVSFCWHIYRKSN